jgi:starch synthase
MADVHMLVTFITPEYPPQAVGGLGTHVQALARGLAVAGVEVHVFCAAIASAQSYQDGRISVRYIAPPGRENDQPYSLDFDTAFKLNMRVAEVVEEHFSCLNKKPSIVHIHDWFGFKAAARLRSVFGAPVITTLHTFQAALLSLFRIRLAGNTVIELEEQCCRGSDRIITVSESVAQDLKSIYSIPSDKIDVVWNGFDTESFSSQLIAPERIQAMRAAWLKEGERAILFAGRLGAQKGVLPLLRSAKEVITQAPDVRYLIVGEVQDNQYVKDLQLLASRDPVLCEKVTFLGKVRRDELAILYQFASVAVVPSLYEPFGYAATEPMSLGRPVVATRVGGLQEIIEHNRSGLLVATTTSARDGLPDLDVESFTQAQLELLNDPAKAAWLGEEARQRVEQEFSCQNMVEKTLGCYRSTMNCQLQAVANG